MLLARLLPDFSPAREHPAFRRLLAGGLLSNLGGSMTSFAVVLQVWDLSRSSLAVGLLGLTFVPVLLVGPTPDSACCGRCTCWPSPATGPPRDSLSPWTWRSPTTRTRPGLRSSRTASWLVSSSTTCAMA